MDIVEELTARAASYRSGGPSSEHTANLLDEAAAEITRLRALVAEAATVVKPFADLSAVFSKHDADELWCFMRLFHIRAAAQWMEKKNNG